MKTVSLKRWRLWTYVVILGLAALIVAMLFIPSNDDASGVKAQERAQGLHCLGGSGVHVDFFTLVQSQLRDPDSMKMSQTRTNIGPVSGGKHRIVMEFRARNAMGGMERGDAIGGVDHETCKARLERID